MAFSLDEKSFEKELDETYFLASSLSLDIKPACFGKTKAGNIARKPTKKAALWEPVPQDFFEERGDALELFPALILGQCGKRKEYLVCVDIDVKGGKDGLKELDKKYPELIFVDTVKEKTASGGQHLFFKTKKKLPVRIGFLPGVDLLGEQLGNPRMVFVPPALGKCLKKRHEWVKGCSPSEREVAWLPKDFEAVWLGKGDKEKEKTYDKAPADFLTDVFLLEGALPAAIEQCINTVTLEPLSRALECKLDKLTQTISGDDYCTYRVLTRSFWLKLAYLSKKVLFTDDKGTLDDQKQKEVFLDIARLFPQFQGDEETGSQWDAVYADKIKLGGGYVKKILEDELVKQVYKALAAQSEELVQEVSEEEEGEEREDKKEKDAAMEEVVSIQEKLASLILDRKEKSSFFRLADLVNSLFCDREHPLVGILLAHSLFAATFQYDYSIKALKNLPAASPNNFVGVFSGTGTGKDILFKIYRQVCKSIGVERIDEPKSPIGFFRQVSGKAKARDLTLLIDEVKQDGAFFLKNCSGVDKALKKTHTKLYDGILVGWRSKTEDEAELENVFENMFFASSFSEFKDDFLSQFDYEHGIGNRPLIYIVRNTLSENDQENYKSAVDVEDDYFVDGRTGGGKPVFEELLGEFCRKDAPKLKELRNRWRSGVGRDVWYKSKFPVAVGEDGEPIFELIEKENSAKEREGKEKKKKKEDLLRKLINDVDPYNPEVLSLDSRGVDESIKALRRLQEAQGQSEAATRLRLHGLKLALTLELGRDIYPSQQVVPKTVSAEAIADGELIAVSCMRLWELSAEKLMSARTDVTFQQKAETELIERVRKKIKYRLKKSESVSWKMLKHTVQRDKEIRRKDDFFNFVHENLGDEFLVDFLQGVIRKK